MKYHIVPTQKRITSEVSFEERQEANELNHEMVGLLKKIVKRDDETCNELFYLHDSTSMSRLMNLLNTLSAGAPAEVFIHAEGSPFMIGSSMGGGEFSLTAFQLASHLKKNRLLETPISINLMACNSATNFMGSNFARDLSQALTHCFNCSNVSVIGYTGFISVKNNGKFAVSSVLGRSIKGTHSNLDDAKKVYESGELKSEGRQLISDLSDAGFEWASKYIHQMHTERGFIDAAIERQRGVHHQHVKTSFFKEEASNSNASEESELKATRIRK